MNYSKSPYYAEKETLRVVAPIVAECLRETLNLLVVHLNPLRWVTTEDYAKHYHINRRTLLIYRQRFIDNNAISGRNRGIRYDKFYDVRENKRNLVEWAGGKYEQCRTSWKNTSWKNETRQREQI